MPEMDITRVPHGRLTARAFSLDLHIRQAEPDNSPVAEMEQDYEG